MNKSTTENFQPEQKLTNEQKPMGSTSSPATGNTNVMCRLFGHKVGNVTDGGYPVCKRCEAHSYWDNGSGGGVSNRWNHAGILLRPFWLIRWKCFQMKCDIKRWYSRTFKGDELPF